MIKIPLKPEGKVYRVKGKEVMMYPIATVAKYLTKALGEPRTTQTIRKWEQKGVIPSAPFRVKDKRLYTMEHIKALCKVAKDENIRQGYSISLTRFSAKLAIEYKAINDRIKQGNIPQERGEGK